MAIDLQEAPYNLNLADDMDAEVLARIGTDLKEQIEIDEMSRQEWMETNKDWLKLAAQVREAKSFPWPGASNVKYPLLTIASMQFHARALPNLVNSAEPIKMRIIGRDPQQEKLARGERVAQYMSYQIMEEMDEWMEEMDRLLFILPMVGICYKKTYWSEAKESITSKLVLPNDLIVNYHAQGFDRARMTQVLYLDSNEVMEHQAAGVFLDEEIHSAADTVGMDRNAMDSIGNIKKPSESDMTPYELYESHCYLDLDEDGYKEPYIVTLTKEGQVLRVIARWSEDGLSFNQKGDVKKIVPDSYFTPYVFMPDPASAVSGLGLGTLIGPINETVNTLVNQLVDAGTLANMQGGFLGRGIKLRGGATRFRPGEWKMVNSTGDDLRKNIFPMPVKEPSGVLFQLLGMLIDSGERVSAVSDIMVGENPGQNQPATTTMATLEQGLQVFTSIFKRIHRSLSKEYHKLYKLNSIYLDVDKYNAILDEYLMQENQEGEAEEYGLQDFRSDNFDIKPASDPSIVSQAQKSVKAQALMEKMSMGMPLNVQEVTRRTLEAEEHEDIKALMDVPAPKPDPKMQIEQGKLQIQGQKLQIDQAKIQQQGQIEMAKLQQQAQMEQIDAQLEALKAQSGAGLTEAQTLLTYAQAEEIGISNEMAERAQELKEIEVEAKIINDRLKAMTSKKPTGKTVNEAK